MEKSKQQEAQEKTAKVQSRVVHTSRVFFLREDTVQIAGRPTKTWDIIVHPGAVVIIPVNDRGELLLVKQWRRAAAQVVIELPAGTLEEDEPIFTCAQRELQEETGYLAKELIPFGGCYTIPGYCTEYLHFFLALGLQHSPLPPDEDEQIDLVAISLDKALEMIDNGLINDAKTIAGILRYERWLKKQ